MLVEEIKILLIEDDEDDAFLVKEYLSDVKNFVCVLDWEANPERGKVKILEGKYDLFLIDFYLGKSTGLSIIDFIQKNQILTPAILLTGRNDAQIDVDASMAGAFDYLVKGDLRPDILERSIRYSIKQSRIIRELDEKEKKYRSLFERSLDCIFLANSDYSMLELNDSFLDFFGYKPSQNSLLHLRDIFANQEDFEYCVEQLKVHEVVKDFEVVLLTKDREPKDCLFNCVFIPDQADDFCCYQGIIRDLTFRKRAEREMMVAEKLSMTGKLARTIAHEIRNPLTNLNLALDNLKEEISDREEDSILYTDIIQRSSNRIETLIGDLLNSSKPKELQLELSSLHRILDDVLELVRDRAKLRGIRIAEELEEELPRIFVDREKLSIALVNILINGIEAIEHAEGLLSVQTELRGSSIFLVIADNGQGIAKEDLKKIFDPFYTSKSEGTGLGLTSTLNILSSHNASIQVSSTVGVGTRFEIEFPLPMH
ncbi:PAS domain S-box protein [Algoriphagus aestuariicola]|uniref:histidine kinase n=1 Tax=Algoriphagus aestuariicola TaxID=1852016 RepID=A0ABS3BV09_9BACT|nr:hybrid sensor histidine kinase/response regulator [Algoriphagus aestuariicola]MBN7802912.1 PAS domain S-box protein [Algoriphagus aestuariicola]